MQIQRKSRVNFRQQPTVGEIAREFANLQVTQQDPDKITFNSYEVVENLIYNKQNADVRRGVSSIGAISDILGIGTYKTNTTEKLYGVVQTTTTSKLVEINESTGATTDKVTGITGTGIPSFASMNGILNVANGSADLVQYDGSSDYTVALPSGKPELIETDGSRIWATTGPILYFSQKPTTGRVTSFAITGSSLSRAGIASTAITKFTAIRATNDVICVAGNGVIEGHRVPKASDGLSTFPEEISTLQWSIDDMVVESRYDMVAIDSYLFVKTKDGNFYRINTINGSVKPILTNEGQFQDYNFDKACLGYDSQKNLVYIGGRKVSSQNNTMFCYNLRYNNFSVFPNLTPNHFTFVNNQAYYLNNEGNKIIKAFADDVFTDFGSKIDWRIFSASTYAGSQKNLKQADLLFLNARVYEDTDITYKFFKDRGIGSLSNNADYEVTYSIEGQSESVIDGFIGGYDIGIWGGAGFSFDGEESVEVWKNEDRINETFFRGQVEVSGSSSNQFSLRGFGFYAIIQTTLVDNITFK